MEKAGIIEYKMPEDVAKEYLKRRQGDDLMIIFVKLLMKNIA